MPALRPSLPMVPMGPPRPARRPWRVGAASLALHALVVALALWLVRPREEGGEAAAPSYELMFQPEGAPEMGDAPPASAAPALPRPDSLPGPATPDPETTPDVAAPPSPESPPAPEVPPQPTAPPVPAPPAPPVARPVTPEAPGAPPPLPQAPEAEVPSASPEASVRLALPEPTPPILPPVPDFVPPSPPPRLPVPVPRVPAPRSAAAPPPRMAPPPGTFANPMDLSFGTGPSRPAAPRLAARPGSVASRSLDLGTGAARAPNRQEAFFDARAARLGADWKDGLEGYWLRHRYYPRQAAESGEDGQVQIELTVNRYGKVETVTVQGRSGSPWLDMAAVAVWRGAQLNPLPAEVAGDHLTFSITINYILLR